jgi:hypothetical protein
VTRLLREGRTALRQAIGIDLSATPQAAQDALLAAAAAFARNDVAGAAAALAPVAARNARPAEALSRIETPPPLRRALRALRNMLAGRDPAAAS